MGGLIQKTLLIVGVALLLVGCIAKYNEPKPQRPTRGAASATVLVEEFADFECPACGLAYPTIKKLQEKYGDSVFWKFYEFPLISIHPYAFNAALAAECANDHGKFWEMHDILFENQKALKNGDLNTYASRVDLDTELYTACFKSRAKSSVVREDMQIGDKRGVQGTPTLFVNGTVVEDWSTLETALDALVPAVTAQEPT